ncbi:hypothetical protein [Mycobacterium sp. ZZG]
MTDLSHHTRELRPGASYAEPGVRDAVRAGFGFAAAGATFLFAAMVWIGTCTGSLAEAAGCGAPQRTMLALGAPAILLVGGLWSLVRSFRVRHGHARWAWQGAGWSLLALMVLSAVVSLPSLPGR